MSIIHYLDSKIQYIDYNLIELDFCEKLNKINVGDLVIFDKDENFIGKIIYKKLNNDSNKILLYFYKVKL